MNAYKNILLSLLKIMLHIGIVVLIVFTQMRICGIVITGNGALYFAPFCLSSLLGCIIQPMLCSNKIAKNLLFYMLCVTNFITPYVLMHFIRDGLMPFTIVICTMLLLYLIVNLSIGENYSQYIKDVRLIIDKNIRFICCIGGLPIFSFILFFQFEPHNAEIADIFKIIELSIVLFWLIYNVVYFYKKYIILVIFLGLAILNLMPQYLDYSFIDIAIILFPLLGLVAIFIKEEKKPRLNFSKDEWLQTIIVAALLILSVLNISLCISGKFPIMFAALQILSYVVAFILFKLTEIKLDPNNSQINKYLLSSLYAIFSICYIYVTKANLTDKFSKHIELGVLFIIFSFIVLTLSKLHFKKYNCIKSALFVFLGGVALNVAIVYNQDLANYATWLPQVLQKHLVMASCYGAAIWIIPKLMRLRISQYNTPTTINEETLCEQEKNN